MLFPLTPTHSYYWQLSTFTAYIYMQSIPKPQFPKLNFLLLSPFPTRHTLKWLSSFSGMIFHSSALDTLWASWVLVNCMFTESVTCVPSFPQQFRLSLPIEPSHYLLHALSLTPGFPLTICPTRTLLPDCCS